MVDEMPTLDGVKMKKKKAKRILILILKLILIRIFKIASRKNIYVTVRIEDDRI